MKEIANPHALILPVNLEREDLSYFLPHFQYQLSKQKIYRYRWLLYFPSGVATNLGGQKIRVNLPWANWGMHFKRSFYLKELIRAWIKDNVRLLMKSDAKYGIVTNPFSDNYFHWMTEVIPKIILIKESIPNIIVVLHSRYSKAYQLESLKLINIPYKIIKKDVFFIKQAFICSPATTYTGYTTKKTVDQLRDLFSASGSESKGRRLYISRNKAQRRTIKNESELLPALLSKGFEIIYPENYTCLELISLFKESKLVIGLHGAALTNMVFCDRGARILELRLEKVIEDKCYYILANSCGHEYYYQNCRSADGLQDHITADVIVDVNKFKTLVERMLNA